MVNYNYQNLSDVDFESLSKDLLGKKLKMEFERFTSGRDGGIDLRCAKDKDGETVVQCKHYKDTRLLISSLKKEVQKVDQIKPKRYIVITSASLTKKNKESIKKLFQPFIKRTTDILGKHDIDDLLKIYKDIEINHYKLWLSSSNVLDRILNSKVYNESEFLLENINERINIYVQNESFKEAVKILNNKNHVVISGIPGIGKSTLAYIIAYYLLGKEFEEFIFMSDSVEVGLQHYSAGKKQVFLFDDFLGKSLLENKLNTNEEQKIINFIKQISKSKDKVLIITTREYVLNQAREKYEAFSHFNWKESKCIVDLSKYTKLIRAKILYNHLYFSDLPKKYIKKILDDKNYLKIIDHPNYSPRVIEQVMLNGKWKEVGDGDFFVALDNYLSNPHLVWDHTFRINISEVGRVILLILLSLGETTSSSDLYSAVESYSEQVGKIKEFNQIEFKKALKELEDTFIVLNKDINNLVVVQFQNPSIQDFLLNFLKENNSYRKDIIQGAAFFNQLFTIFSFEEEIKGKTQISKIELKELIAKIVRDYNQMGRSSLIKVVHKNDKNSYWINRTESDFYKISTILKNIETGSDIKLEKLVKEKIVNFDFTTIKSDDLSHLTSLIYKTDEQPKNIKDFFKDAPHHINWVSDIENYYEVATVYEDIFESSITKEELKNVVNQVVNEEIQSTSPDDCDSLLEKVENLRDNFACELDEEADELKEIIHQFEEHENDKWSDIGPDDLPGLEPARDDEEDVIADMFESLR